MKSDFTLNFALNMVKYVYYQCKIERKIVFYTNSLGVLPYFNSDCIQRFITVIYFQCMLWFSDSVCDTIWSNMSSFDCAFIQDEISLTQFILWIPKVCGISEILEILHENIFRNFEIVWLKLPGPSLFYIDTLKKVLIQRFFSFF